ncbi:hypothetical protein GCM10025867_07860 [Frondihabitans sucicola]|uniref:Glycosyl hydrolase family 32 C-terminal domain-containing protein n=1 Tax=Frondihabitans sucicola TaxID=1268041 RepID=A0ABM8GJJ9_9MICO|nr:GH32 C-terminal domain-containing protein [Frondihabitans sucicola]BDZ48545.1 hypothetical protein GCM10025867_07860 [Frondihabitans sucicola]
MILRFSERECLEILIDWDGGTISIDRSRASSDPRADGRSVGFAAAGLTETRRIGLDVFVDGSIVELFTSAGDVATMRVYPAEPGAMDVEVTNVDTASTGSAWPMRASADGRAAPIEAERAEARATAQTSR